MQFKKYTKQRNGSIQGLRSFKDTLPKNIKKVINKKGHIYSETLSNWKYIVGENLFRFCYPKSFKNSNKFYIINNQYYLSEIGICLPMKYPSNKNGIVIIKEDKNFTLVK